MNRIGTTHRVTWLNVSKASLVMVLLGLLALAAVTVMAIGSWLIDSSPV